ncbi:hypothetical protein MRB53_028089 [Persea americana]|uniref:Uncharacterized protein n=1 Tax=Persea americana TaxID=3435 RepID=A0ACC2KEI5_PERAE|nr:hypothetical protein MRB53_028089 [Persea americana]
MAFSILPSAARISPFLSDPSFRDRAQTRIRVRSEVSGSSEVDSAHQIGTVMRTSEGIGELSLGKGKGKRDLGAEKTEKEELGLLYDDGFGSESVIDYLDAVRELIRPDGGPPRWFCPVECSRPIRGSPLLLFLPGLDGVGLGLILHHKSLGKVFEVRCMHIPVHDRTPFEGLLKLVEETVRLEHSASPDTPIYLVGDSFGGCLALAVAARNPTIDLILILSNPATSFGKSQLHSFSPILEALPEELHTAIPYLLSFIMGDPVKMGMASVEKELPPSQALDQLSRSLTSMRQRLSGLADIIPKVTLLWKLKLLKSAALYANSRLHAVKAEVLVLASGKDNMIPSRDEAERLLNSLQNCKIRLFKDNGHTLLLEDGVCLLTVIKGTGMYRRSRKYDYILDHLPPTRTEFAHLMERGSGWFNLATGPVMLSTLQDGKIVRGLTGVPSEGPVLLVGYHMLMGFELSPLIEAFLREKNVLVRARNFYRLFSSKSFVLLYPGGVREALHRKGEEYKLFWPDQPEFVRMAARFGATIVPFGVVGEDDIVELLLDYNELTRIPFIRDWIKYENEGFTRLRTDFTGEVANQDLFLPAMVPKIPGRFYYLFGKPFETKGKAQMLKDRQNASELYLQIKSQVESIISYLRKKREEDPYRGILQRAIYQATWGSKHPVPTFEP